MILERKKISENVELCIYDLKELCKKTVAIIDDHLVQICEGDSGSSIAQTKLTFIDFLKNKNETTKIGAIAEFFVHLFLRQSGYRQEFLFYNLEERSIKKGFDGYFSKDNAQYIAESKSGLHSSVNISHQSKIKEAYRDLSSNVSGKSKKSISGSNNPWRNAYNHASHIDVNTSQSIRKNLKELSDSFDKGIYQNIENLNIIPCSTIFLDNTWDNKYTTSILQEENSFYEQLKAQHVKVICITNSSYSKFVSYLEDHNE